MIKRAISPQFRQSIIAGEKVTTIREKPWPINTSIMLYSWTAKPYASPHDDLIPIRVTAWTRIDIIRTKGPKDNLVFSIPWIEPGIGRNCLPPVNYYWHKLFLGRHLYSLEGFPDEAAMQAWFLEKWPKNQDQKTMYLNKFEVYQPSDSQNHQNQKLGTRNQKLTT